MFKALLIDDDPVITNGVETILNRNFSGVFDISKAYDGYEALKNLTVRSYAMIVSDIKMPLLNGIQLLELLHKYSINSTVIMLSGYDDYIYIRSALRLGARDYLLKPINIQAFTELVQELLPELQENEQNIVSLLPMESFQFLPVRNASNHYFDLPLTDDKALSPEALQAKLDILSASVLKLDEEKVCSDVNMIFGGLAESSIGEDTLKRYLENFIYSLIAKCPSLIRIVAQYKLTDNDISTQIKNQPHVSQLKEKFLQILLLYVMHLSDLKKSNEEYVVKRTQDYIEKHYAENIQISDIAALFKLHPNYFSYLYKKQTGNTLRNYLMNVRIAKAQEMMKNPSSKIIDIALAVGYQDAAHFNRTFHNVIGISPTEWRREIIKS